MLKDTAQLLHHLSGSTHRTVTIDLAASKPAPAGRPNTAPPAFAMGGPGWACLLPHFHTTLAELRGRLGYACWSSLLPDLLIILALPGGRRGCAGCSRTLWYLTTALAVPPNGLGSNGCYRLIPHLFTALPVQMGRLETAAGPGCCRKSREPWPCWQAGPATLFASACCRTSPPPWLL